MHENNNDQKYSTVFKTAILIELASLLSHVTTFKQIRFTGFDYKSNI